MALTARVSRKWAGRDNAILTEPTSSHENCLTARRACAVPPPQPQRTLSGFGCTLCWAALLHDTEHNFRVMEVILQRFIKSAHVDSIHDSMMPLYAERHLPCIALLEVFSPGEAGDRIRRVELHGMGKACERYPRYRGHVQHIILLGVGFQIRMCFHIRNILFSPPGKLGKMLSILNGTKAEKIYVSQYGKTRVHDLVLYNLIASNALPEFWNRIRSPRDDVHHGYGERISIALHKWIKCCHIDVYTHTEVGVIKGTK